MLSSIVERSKETNREDEVIEEGVFIFKSPEDDRNILTPYELREGQDFETERDKAAAQIYGKEVN